ncbi:hypothetical protein M9458_006850 [Cirrhinus mrigala]|uniref:VLIG-type G domain-containing protein n=1 Tax=Cirrhinus mrigala TaxID=683832 RepID=A0ABD0RJN4_CIRMR
MTDYRARYIPIKEKPSEVFKTQRTMMLDTGKTNAFEKIFKRCAPVNEQSRRQPIHPMDIQMIVYLYADNFLRQLMVTKLSQCQYALPLLVPSPFTQEIEFPLWTFRQIKKSWKSHKRNVSKNQTIHQAETPMIAFFRFSEVSASKSELMNSLINERHYTFFHRHCCGSSKSRLLMDGVVEIAWYCPSGDKNDKFPDCVAFCNLHGDAQANETQLKILTEESSINVVLLPNLDKSDKSMAMVEKLYSSRKPLICLLTEDESGVSRLQEGKYTIGLKQRNKSDISEDVRRAIKACLSKPLSVFKLVNIGKHTGIKVDENDDDCRRGKDTAEWMVKLLEGKELSKIKETFLPCQGKLWHDWCLKNKELYRPQGDNIEMHNSKKQTEMHKIREQQKASGLSNFMKLFTDKIYSRNVDEKMYFLKWLGILLDEYTEEDLSMLHHKYDEKWSKVLDLKKKHDKSEHLTAEQSQLEMLSEKLNAATFGLEHILREIGQIYESGVSVKKNKRSGCELDVSSLPQTVAELMISGYPLELMDGDAAHVPLIWVQAVLDELIKILGDQSVFVLSVLGIQSTGKSTMLNAMFGLQFAVSAGRCTRGAFMQLVKVSEELRKQLKFDYILVVDTEGLRALELAGRSTRNHDNEMATFVVGLGNMTLINIFGENPAEMQDILQIVVQAFLRMKKVRLNPSCMFVHQNVGDITAGEKNMVGKRHLQEKLDEMTQLAAKEEVCDAECFSDVIKFDIKTDVRYFAQLWEGSPPMAPPNPCYSENVQELKSTILSHASKSKGVTLAQFRDRIGDLWNALLNENFVFSFKNTLEIVTYRKLEEEYAKWTWSLRSTMLEIEDKLRNRINNRQLHKIESRELEEEMGKTFEKVKIFMKHYFEENKEKEILIQWKLKFQEKIKHLYGELVRDAKTKLENIIYQKEALTKLDGEKTLRERRLLEKSKELAFSLKHKALDENEEANDPVIYLEKKKPEYYSVFQRFCKGATSAAVFGALICSELKNPILQSVYNKTANDLAGEMRTNIPAFNGNRSNLEKHILKTLAEEEDFHKFMEYINYARDHFEDFIQREVKAYITEGDSSALAKIKGNIRHKEQCIISAAETATVEVLSKGADANMWLEIFSDCLKDELEYSKEHLTGNCCQDITDFELLEEAVKKELRPITEELNRDLQKPSDIKMEIVPSVMPYVLTQWRTILEIILSPSIVTVG